MADAADGSIPFTKPAGAAAPARAAGLSPEGHAALPAGAAVDAALDALLAAGHGEDAVKLLAHALPRREGVWWACRCAATAPRPPADGPPSAELTAHHEAAVKAEDAARAVAETWCAGQTDEQRRAALPAGEAANDSPSGLAALACFFAAGSLAPPDVPAVPPPPDAGPNLAAGAVLLAAVRTDPATADVKRAGFVAVGRQVAAGADRWPDALPPPRASAPLPTAPPPPDKPKRTSYY